MCRAEPWSLSLPQGGLLQTDCQQMQALYLLSAAAREPAAACGGCPLSGAVGPAVLLQAAGCEAARPVVRTLALCLLGEGSGSGGSSAGLAGLTPLEFLQTGFAPSRLLAAPTLLELQLRWADGCVGGARYWVEPLWQACWRGLLLLAVQAPLSIPALTLATYPPAAEFSQAKSGGRL